MASAFASKQLQISGHVPLSDEVPVAHLGQAPVPPELKVCTWSYEGSGLKIGLPPALFKQWSAHAEMESLIDEMKEVLGDKLLVGPDVKITSKGDSAGTGQAPPTAEDATTETPVKGSVVALADLGAPLQRWSLPNSLMAEACTKESSG